MDKPEILPTDIIPMVSYAWSRSFVRMEKNLKAIENRGWGALNYALLNKDKIQATITELKSKSTLKDFRIILLGWRNKVFTDYKNLVHE